MSVSSQLSVLRIEEEPEARWRPGGVSLVNNGEQGRYEKRGYGPSKHYRNS